MSKNHYSKNNEHSNNTEIELQESKAHAFKKVKSFNVRGADYNNVHNEDNHDEHQHLGSGHARSDSANYYVIDPEMLKNGKIVIEIKDKTANPAALGLLGFGLTTFLLNMHNSEVYPMNSMILAMGFCYGGAA